jgi:hypothetical protein
MGENEMIRTLVMGAAMFAFLTVSATAQNALSFWDGIAVIDSVSAACKNAGTPPGSSAGYVDVNDVYNSSYRARLDASEPNSGITFVAKRSMQTYFHSGGAATDQMNGSGTYALRVLRGNVTSAPSPSAPTLPSGNYKFKIKPATITAATDAITIDGTISNWRGTTNCTVKLRGSYRANPLNP